MKPMLIPLITAFEDQHGDEDEEDHVRVELLYDGSGESDVSEVVAEVAEQQPRNNQHWCVRELGLLADLAQQATDEQSKHHEEHNQRARVLFLAVWFSFSHVNI
ncbi:MAG: hypothetical protein JST59_00525 [Actinobacteria bacterium]|nr:hypothetical protein [Actinomycetota bacterium]